MYPLSLHGLECSCPFVLELRFQGTATESSGSAGKEITHNPDAMAGFCQGSSLLVDLRLPRRIIVGYFMQPSSCSIMYMCIAVVAPL